MTEIVLVIFWLSLAMLFYAQAGYPLLMALASRRHGEIVESPTRWPRVSLIIPAYNEQGVLAAKLENTLQIDYPSGQLEILVASDGSDDGTVEIARSFESRGVNVLAFAKRRGKASVLNDAASRATGELLCLCDANVLFRPNALRRLVARFQDDGVGAVSGEVRLSSQDSDFGAGESMYYRIERAVQRGESSVGSMMGVDGGMYLVRRELYQPLPPETILDDFAVSMNVIRQGKRVVYEPRAVADENATPSARQEFRRRVRIAAGAVQSLRRRHFPPARRPVEAWQFVSHKLLRWAGPALLPLLLLSNGLLWNAGVGYRVALGGQVFVYALAAAGMLSLRIRQTQPGGVAFYFVMSHAAMSVGLLKGALNRQRVTWAKAERGRHDAALETARPN